MIDDEARKDWLSMRYTNKLIQKLERFATELGERACSSAAAGDADTASRCALKRQAIIELLEEIRYG